MRSSFVFSLTLLLAFWFSCPLAIVPHGTPSAGMAIGLVLCLVMLAVRQGRRQGRDLWDWRWGAPLLGLIGLVAIQAANPSHQLSMGSGWLVPIDHVRFLPRSVDRMATLGALLLLGAYAVSFWLSRALLRDTGSRMTFLGVQAAGGLAMAAFMHAQYRHGPDGALYAVTGVFVNPNHYAAYVNLLWPVCWLWGWERIVQSRRSGSGQAVVGVALCLAGVGMSLSLALSNSHMGMLVAMAAVVGIVAHEGWSIVRPHWRTCKAAISMSAAVLAVGAAAGMWLTGWGGAAGRMAAMVFDAARSRTAIYPAVWRMWGDRWFSGVGAGAFEWAFPFYQPHAVPGFFRHAHNDFLQMVAELGVVGTLLVLWTVYQMMTVPSRDDSGEAGAVGSIGMPVSMTARERWGLVLALAGLGLHAMVDFPLRAPAICLLAAAWVGVAGGQLAFHREPKH